MIFGINGSTTEPCDQVKDIEIAAKAGYGAMELRMSKIAPYIESGGTLAELRRLLEKNGLIPASINSIEDSTLAPTPEEEARILAQVERFSVAAKDLGCSLLILCPGKKIDGMSWDEVLTRSAKTLATLADAAWKWRIHISFEFLGWSWCSVQTPSEAWAVVQEANRGNIGLTVDVANFQAGPGLLGEISALPAGAINMFHLNDTVDKPKSDIGVYDRVFPGDGTAPAREIALALKRIGYDGHASVETFNHDYNKMDPLEVAKTALEKSRALFK